MPLQSKKSVAPVRQLATPPGQLATPPGQPVNSPLLETIKHSVAMGAGMSIGQRIVGGIMGPTGQTVVEKQIEKCKEQRETMDQCMKFSAQDSPCYEELRSYVSCLNKAPN